MRGAPLFSLRSAVGRLTRRSFLTRLGATAVALTLARHLPGIAPTPLTLTPPNGVYAGASLQRGDMFTLEGRYEINPITWKPTRRSATMRRRRLSLSPWSGGERCKRHG